jgi:hypothetical protein
MASITEIRAHEILDARGQQDIDRLLIEAYTGGPV